MDIESLSDFITLANCKSFSKAAALRNVTQPAFSRRIRALESMLTTDLIDRRSKSFQLTPAGERFLAHAKNLVDVSHRAVEDTRSLMTRLHQPVYVSTPSYLSKTFFPDWYKRMQKSIPGLTMRLSVQQGSGAISDLHKGLADFSIVMNVDGAPACYNFEGLHKRVVGRDKMVAVRARHAKNTAALLMHEQGSYMSSCADMILGKKYKGHEVVFESTSTGLLKEMALAGFGIAFLPESLVEDDLLQGFLVPVAGTMRPRCDILLVRAKQPSHKKAEKLWALNVG